MPSASTSSGGGPRPAAWLVDNVDLIPRRRPVLDVASGTGRHALWLAASGWSVHAVDRDAEALAALAGAAQGLAGRVTTEVLDLEQEDVRLPAGPYGAVLVFNYLHRPLMPAIVRAVGPGGVLVYETFTTRQAARGGPRNPAFLLREGELDALIRPLEALRSREGEFDGRFVASVVARRPARAALSGGE